MDYAQIWNSAIKGALDDALSEEDRQKLELFRHQVSLNVQEGNFYFSCSSAYVKDLFAPFASRMVKEVEHVTGRECACYMVGDASAAQHATQQMQPFFNQPQQGQALPSFPSGAQGYPQSANGTAQSQNGFFNGRNSENKNGFNDPRAFNGPQNGMQNSGMNQQGMQGFNPQGTLMPQPPFNGMGMQGRPFNQQPFMQGQMPQGQMSGGFGMHNLPPQMPYMPAQMGYYNGYFFQGQPFYQGYASMPDPYGMMQNPFDNGMGQEQAAPQHQNGAATSPVEDDSLPTFEELQAKNALPSGDVQQDMPATDTVVKPRREYEAQTATYTADTEDEHLSKLQRLEKYFPNFKKRSQINPNKTFDNYVIDPENKTLYVTAMTVAANPCSSSYNPLYIYGASGLGKTHLLFAIANHIRKEHPKVSVIYSRAEEFIRHYVESIASIKKSPFADQQVHFQDLYTEHDVFIVDDIQNFIRGPQARNAFFDIIAEFIDKPNRQLILASDVPPGDLKGFNPRLTTRFGSGVCCEVVPPGVETRTAITISKCKEMGINLSEEIINYIAQNVRSNVRELEGAIKTLNSHMRSSGVSLTVDDAKKILTNLVNASNQVCTIDTIKERVSQEFEVPVQAMESAEKKKAVSLARSIAMALARDLIPSMSLSDIGRAFNKDHSSVHEAIKRIRKKIDTEPEVASKYNKLTLSLKLN